MSQKAGTATKLIGYCGVLTLDFGDELAGLGVALTTAPEVLGYRSPRCNWGLGIQQRIKCGLHDLPRPAIEDEWLGRH